MYFGCTSGWYLGKLVLYTQGFTIIASKLKFFFLTSILNHGFKACIIIQVVVYLSNFLWVFSNALFADFGPFFHEGSYSGVCNWRFRALHLSPSTSPSSFILLCGLRFSSDSMGLNYLKEPVWLYAGILATSYLQCQIESPFFAKTTFVM